MTNLNWFHKENFIPNDFHQYFFVWGQIFQQSASKIPKCVLVQLFAHFIRAPKALDEISWFLKYWNQNKRQNLCL